MQGTPEPALAHLKQAAVYLTGVELWLLSILFVPGVILRSWLLLAGTVASSRAGSLARLEPQPYDETGEEVG